MRVHRSSSALLLALCRVGARCRACRLLGAAQAWASAPRRRPASMG